MCVNGRYRINNEVKTMFQIAMVGSSVAAENVTDAAKNPVAVDTKSMPLNSHINTVRKIPPINNKLK